VHEKPDEQYKLRRAFTWSWHSNEFMEYFNIFCMVCIL